EAHEEFPGGDEHDAVARGRTAEGLRAGVLLPGIRLNLGQPHRDTGVLNHGTQEVRCDLYRRPGEQIPGDHALADSVPTTTSGSPARDRAAGPGPLRRCAVVISVTAASASAGAASAAGLLSVPTLQRVVAPTVPNAAPTRAGPLTSRA